MSSIAYVSEVLPWAIWAFCGIALAFALFSRPIAASIVTPRWVVLLLGCAAGLVIAVTLTPLDVGAASSAPPTMVTRDIEVVQALSPLWNWWGEGERPLNLLLFVPLGLAVGLVRRRSVRLVLICLALLVPLAVESLQFLFTSLYRDSQWQDVIDNTLGTVVGLAIGYALRWIALRRPVAAAEPRQASRSASGLWPRWWSVLATVVLAAVLAGTAWIVSAWLHTYRDAVLASDALTLLREQVANDDWDAAMNQLPRAAAAVDLLANDTRTTQWRILEQSPLLGATATSARVFSGSVSRILHSAQELVPSVTSVLSGDLRRDGRFDLRLATDAIAPMENFAAELARQKDVLSALDLTQVREPLASSIPELVVAADDYQAPLTSAIELARRIPPLLGSQEPRDWLVLLENPAETRGAGGFVGGYAILGVSDGTVQLKATGTSADLLNSDIPTGDAPGDSKALWGRLLTHWNTYNLSPHFPLTAELSVAGMRERGTPVDGVIAVTPAAVAALLQVTGPVSVGGRTLDAGNVEQFFAVDIYSQIENDNERNRVSMALVAEVFSALLTVPADPALLRSLDDSADRVDFRVWSANPDEQSWLESKGVAGVVPDTAGSVVAIALNNAAATKADAFVASEVDYLVGRCSSDPVQQSLIRVQLTNEAPQALPNGPEGGYRRVDDPDAPLGSTQLLVHFYAPVGAEFSSALLDGNLVNMNVGTERNRPVWWTYLSLDPGERAEISVAFREPIVLGVPPAVIPQAMVVDQKIEVSENAICPEAAL